MDHEHHHHTTSHRQELQKYTCPMHPEITEPEPGRCPRCGMDLVKDGPAGDQTHKHTTAHMDADKTAVHDHAAHGMHDKHAGHHTQDFLRRFWICLIVTIPVLLLSPMIQYWLGFELKFPGDKYLLLSLSTFIYFYGGMPFLKGMGTELKHKAIGMMTLVAIAITVAFIYSVAVVFGLEGMDFFWELATLIVIMLLGHWLEMRSSMAASKALESLVQLLPSTVHIERNGQMVDISLKELRKGDHVLVKPGEKVPADGKVIEGISNVNESMLTGESIPVKKEKDQEVIGGSINGDGALKVYITATGNDSYLNKVIDMVTSAQASKSKTQNLADKVAKWLTIISITVGVITFVFWINKGQDMAFALERMVTVMVTACPHALGVAIPLVIAISTSLSATHGLLIRNRTAFETARHLDTIIFDKTGTLTKGSHEVKQVIALDSHSREELLQYAASVQQNSEHHIGQGVMRMTKNMGLKYWPVTDFEYMQGIGVKGRVNGKTVISAGPNYFRQNDLPIPATPDTIDTSMETVNYLLIDKKPAGIFTLADEVRESAADAIAELKRMNIRSYLLTGDNEEIAKAVAGKLIMDGYFANVLPHQKQEKLKEFQAKGEKVAMTGDGVNDAPALAQADVGIAVGSGTDVAAETADVILVNSDPRDVVRMIAFAKATYNKMVQNLAWAVGYNLVAIPLAAGIFYPKFILSPAMGAVLMSLSTVIVAFNAQLLKHRFRDSSARPV